MFSAEFEKAILAKIERATVAYESLCKSAKQLHERDREYCLACTDAKELEMRRTKLDIKALEFRMEAEKQWDKFKGKVAGKNDE